MSFQQPGRVVALVLAFAVAADALAASVQPVQTETAVREPIVERLRVTGTVRTPQYSSLSSAVAGLVDSYSVDAGDRVDQGDVLITLDVEQESLRLERIRAQQGQVEVELADARRLLAEAERLGRQADIAETEVESRRAAVKRLEAALRAAAAEVAEQAANVRRHTIRAPFSGVVVSREADPGEWINPGDLLLELVAVNTLWFDFQVPQSVYPKVSRDSQISLVLDALPDEIIEGQVSAIVPVKDPSARTFLLRATSRAANGLPITPGMSVRGVLTLDTGRSAVTVSRDALLRYQDGRTTVWTLAEGPDGPVAKNQRVEIGLEFNGRVEIRSGLESGATVVARGNESLRPGQRVSVR